MNLSLICILKELEKLLFCYLEVSPAPFLVSEEKNWTVVAIIHILGIASRCAWLFWKVMLTQCKLQQDERVFCHGYCSITSQSLLPALGDVKIFVHSRALAEGLSRLR